MIETLMELLDRDIDDASRRLADVLAERAAMHQAAAYWREQLNHPQSLEGVSDAGAGIADFLLWGAKADRELKTLAEKDFLVEERISECRNALLHLSRRRDTLKEVMARRRREAERREQRRRERDIAQRGAAREAAAKGEATWR